MDTLLVVFLSAIAGAAFYFGSTGEITWLCIIGFIPLFIAFLESGTIGKTAAVLIIIFLVLAKVFGWFTGSSYAIVRWIFTEGVSLYTIARLAIVVCFEMALYAILPS